MTKAILGISAFYHDSAAVLIVDGEVIAAAHEERFTRVKHDNSFPHQAVEYCLGEAGLSLSGLDAVVLYDKPFLKFGRLLETYVAFAPRGLRSFLAAMPPWVKEKLFLRRLLAKELKSFLPKDGTLPQVLLSLHHLSHAASAFYPSPFEEAAILTIDGVGEWATTSFGKGRGNKVELLEELHFPHSLGLLYSAFTYYTGFRVNSGEYKLMGLAPYGNGEDPETEKFEQCIREHMVDIRPDGSVWLNQKFFNYATGLTMTADGEWEKLFGVARREPEAPVTQSYCNMALAIQHVTEEVVLKMAKHAQDLTGARYLCLAGGVALNCVANSKIIDAGIFEDVWVQPAAGDAGGALGAALAAWHMYFGEPRAKKSPDAMRGAYLGPEYSDMEAIKQLRPFRASFKAHTDFAELSKHVATLIADGNVVGWFQGRMEWGPRALGNRSILGDPRSSDMQKKMHLKIKYRESFRPFAPAVMEEHAAEYFHFSKRSPYMLFVAPVESRLRVPKPVDYEQWTLEQRLYFQRSSVPAITHLGYSARLQTVGKETNERFWALLDSFYQKTGCPLVINTSFNVRGEPIVCTPADAYRCFMNTEMDYLVIGNLLFEKGQQPAWEKDTSYASQLD